MYLYRRLFSCTGSAGVVPHLMLDLTELASERIDTEVALWRGAVGISPMTFSWVLTGQGAEDLRSRLNELRGDRSVAALFDELRDAGWDGRPVDEVAIFESPTNPNRWRSGSLIEEEQFELIGPSATVALSWLNRLAEAAERAGAPAEVVTHDRWSSRRSFAALRPGRTMDDFIHTESLRQASSDWRELRRGAARHLVMESPLRVLWQRVR